MSSIQLIHNPRCSKSREALQILQKNGIEPDVIFYMKDKLNKTELKEILKKLDLMAVDIVRTGEPVYKAKYKDGNYTPSEWMKILVDNPQLIERPIIINGDRAIIGRPSSKIMEFLLMA